MFIIFLSVISLIIWRPKGLNEWIPTAIGAAITIFLGIVPLDDIYKILDIVSGASITILSTIIMSIVLESIGFFNWVAFNLVKKAKGSGTLLYIFVNLICFLTTIFFNNDGSILITTPIIIHMTKYLKLKPHQKIPYLLSGALIATASSAPIAISNISNLIALKIVGIDLNSYIEMMFIPSMIGIVTIASLLYLYYKKAIPKKITQNFTDPLTGQINIKIDWWMFRVCMVIVVAVRASFFILTPFGIPMEWIALAGAILIIMIRWYKAGKGVKDVISKTPWHILIFAFSMYVLVYGLQNVGLTSFLVTYFQPLVESSHLNASLTMGILLTFLSNLFNNLPAVMIGTLSLTDMGLDLHTLQLSYLANVLGSDIGSLITPVGTLATLIWMYILKSNRIRFTWGQYIKVAVLVIPIGLITSLVALYFWNEWFIFK
ncbi:arsenic transporter [Neobacillus sp. SuZ13]|uniref:arsenic transporter n=1 Tax=Neobacillus sp. SuZ13 TaxID=3047875 RepID=UPI0024BFA1DE|nr:arsenic transporter [Neobacillus sp. SuZ13]WHY65145.1 arsenic transporter [Neobacillus sp. SuZ13]